MNSFDYPLPVEGLLQGYVVRAVGWRLIPFQLSGPSTLPTHAVVSCNLLLLLGWGARPFVGPPACMFIFNEQRDEFWCPTLYLQVVWK
jgi:hypothetical protein